VAGLAWWERAMAMLMPGYTAGAVSWAGDLSNRAVYGSPTQHSKGDATATIARSKVEDEAKQAWFKARYDIRNLNPSRKTKNVEISGRLDSPSMRVMPEYQQSQADLRLYDMAVKEEGITPPYEPGQPWAARDIGAHVTGSASLPYASDPLKRTRELREKYGTRYTLTGVGDSFISFLRRLGVTR
jgi:hypothetical protein